MENLERTYDITSAASIIFDPAPSFSGYWFFPIENLKLNSLVENDVNLFDKFYDEVYLNEIKKIFESDNVDDLQVGFISVPNNSENGRILKLSKYDFYQNIITNYLNGSIDKVDKDEKVYNEFIKSLVNSIDRDFETCNIVFANALKEKKKYIKDAKNNEFNSRYFDASMEDYKLYSETCEFREYLDNLEDRINTIERGLNRLVDFFDKDIDFEKLSSCFSDNTFYLLFSKIILDYNLSKEKFDNTFDKSIISVCQYNQLLNDLIEKDSNYEANIKYRDNVGNLYNYSTKDFQNEFNLFKERHQEISSYRLPLITENKEKYKNIVLMDKIVELKNNESNTNWKFLSDGESIKLGDNNNINERISVLERSGYVDKPLKDTLDNYAFIYGNSLVVIDGFKENKATYVIELDDFIKIVNEKLDVDSYIKSVDSNGMKRIYHTNINTWQTNLYSEINNIDNFNNVIYTINELEGVSKNV